VAGAAGDQLRLGGRRQYGDQGRAGPRRWCGSRWWGLKPDTVLVAAMDPGAKVRNLNTVRATSGGSAVARDVNCHLPSGAMDATQSLVSYDTNS
jgi:hypothetical protein